MQKTTPDLMSAISRGLQAGQSIRQAPLVEALKRQQIAQAQAQQNRAPAVPAELVVFNGLVELAKSSDPEIAKAAQIELRTRAPAGTSAQERIATNQGLATQVADAAAEKARAVESAKLGEQKNKLPDLRAAIKLAESSAAQKGTTLTALSQANAALPGLTDVVGQLKELAPIATSTFGGKIFDQAVKQSGFGATKGSTAKAKFISIVNNQVLPLLKQTFGAAFTENDRQSLIVTMGDPDASPGEKMAQLDSFIEGKVRDIESKERELQGLEDASQAAPQQPKRLIFNPETGRLE